MKALKRLLKWIVGLSVVVVAVLYITDYEHILKGVRVVWKAEGKSLAGGDYTSRVGVIVVHG